jgi:hypothetical protein
VSTATTWTCPNCKRRVPSRVPACHCGTTRDQADLLEGLVAPGAPAPSEPLSWDLKALAGMLVLTVLLGAGSLFLPRRASEIAPLLGWANLAPSPTPTPRPVPTPAPLFKLPWWK